MALKVKAKEREMKVGKNPGEYRYVMLPELYSTLDRDCPCPCFDAVKAYADLQPK